jgi:hypothetical protein
MTAMTAVPVTPPGAPARDLLRPFVLLAVVAFVLGFLGYVALTPAPGDTATASALPESAAAPASDDWNLPKHI